MKSGKKRVGVFEKALYTARMKRRIVELPGNWHTEVLRDIRLGGAPGTEAAVVDSFLQIAWRFSVAAGVLTLVLLVYVYMTGIIDYQDIAARFLENPVSFLI